MKKQSLHSKIINSYLFLTDRKSKYQERWFYSNPETIEPTKRVFNNCSVKIRRHNDRNTWLISPKNGKHKHQILFLHGGGFAKNFQWYHWRFMEHLANQLQATVIAPDFPLIPQADRDTMHTHILDVYEWISSEFDIASVTVIGDSSGATLALNTAPLLKSRSLSQPKEFILLSPWLDLTLSNPQIDVSNNTDPLLEKEVLIKLGHKYAEPLAPNEPGISPIYSDLRRIAPITMFIGTRDILLADCRKLKGMMASQPVVFTYREFEGMFHNWMFFNFKEGKNALKLILDHIKYEPSEFELAMQENSIGW